MNLQLLIPIASKAIGRDIGPDVNLFFRARAAVGTSLNPQGQQFFVENWRKLPDFMESPEGQAALATFMNSWAATLVPKPLAAEPKVEPAPLPALQPQPEVPVEQPAPAENAEHATGWPGNAYIT